METIEWGKVLWKPSEEFSENSNLQKYVRWLASNHNLHFDTYDQLWYWSITDLEAFWTTMWEYLGVQSSEPFRKVLQTREMPASGWFQGARLNYARQIFRNVAKFGNKMAFITSNETDSPKEISWNSLYGKVQSVYASLKNMGVKKGDTVASYITNCEEAVIAFLASAALGAIWSSCSPEFGVRSVVDRFEQIKPKVLFAVDSYTYNGKIIERSDSVSKICSAIPSIEHLVVLAEKRDRIPNTQTKNKWLFSELESVKGELSFEEVPFEHPLWILFSSGTTGVPKAITHSHGGIILEHMKQLTFHMNLKPDDTFFWYTTTGWMMWNLVLGGLLVGSKILLYDGNPSFPDAYSIWRLVDRVGVTFFGTSAAYIQSCMKNGLQPGKQFSLSNLHALGSTGSPLAPDGFEWVYSNVKKDIWLASASGGTDICSGFVGGCPVLPVRAGEIQCRYLGARVEAFDTEGFSVIGKTGELVVTAPMPSMPVSFWGDVDNKKYLSAYFETYPGFWKHGDWIKITERGGCIIYGRSDSTIKRHGARLGTSEIYRSVDSVDGVTDSLVIDLEDVTGKSELYLFVVLRGNKALDDSLKGNIRNQIRRDVSPRFIPDFIYAVSEIPKTINGKKLEVPVKRILMGEELSKVLNVDTVANPDSLHFFVTLALNHVNWSDSRSTNG